MSQFSNPSNNAQASATGSSTLVIVGVVLAVLAVILMNVYVEMRVSAAKQDSVTFFRYTGDLEAGKIVERGDFTAIQVPANMTKAFGNDAIRETSPGSGIPADGFRIELMVDVVEEEVLKSSHFINQRGLASRNLPPLGEHQIAISVDSEDQPANLSPGDRIDLYGAIPLSRSNEYMVVMEYVEVAAVGERRSEGGEGARANKYGSITINIDPKQVPLLFDIQQRLPDKEFRISLRSRKDTTTDITGGEAKINNKVLQALRLN